MARPGLVHHYFRDSYGSIHGIHAGLASESLSGTRGAVPVTLTLFILASIVLLIQRHFYINGFRSLFNGHPNMDALECDRLEHRLSVRAGLLYLMAFASADGNTEKSAVFSATCTSTPPLWCRRSFLSANIWSRAPNQKQRRLSPLWRNFVPSIATVIRNGAEVTVPIDSVQVGISRCQSR